MSLVRNMATAALQYALGLQGQGRHALPVPWTPDANIDDCARFCSHVLWGGKPGPISWVDNFKSAGDGTYHAGKSGLQPGDVVLFDWEGNGVGNHVEFCLTPPSSTGLFTTIGANGSDTVNVKVRTRSAYVMGYFRPAWGSASPTPLQPNPEESTVSSQQFRNKKTGEIAVIDPNGVQDSYVPNMDYVNLNAALGVTKGAVVDLEDNVFGYVRGLAAANANRVGAASAQQVWGWILESDWNGKQTAGNRVIGADKKAGTVDDASIAKLAAALPAQVPLTDGQITTLAGRIVTGIRNFILGK